jgi:hypothetical protein
MCTYVRVYMTIASDQIDWLIVDFMNFVYVAGVSWAKNRHVRIARKRSIWNDCFPIHGKYVLSIECFWFCLFLNALNCVNCLETARSLWKSTRLGSLSCCLAACYPHDCSRRQLQSRSWIVTIEWSNPSSYKLDFTNDLLFLFRLQICLVFTFVVCSFVSIVLVSTIEHWTRW